MANLKEKLLSAVLTAAMAVSYLPTVNAFVEDTKGGNAILWRAEFDGTDDTTYWMYRNSGSNITKWNRSQLIHDGMLVMTPNDMSYGRFQADGRASAMEADVTYSDGNLAAQSFIDVTNKTEVIFETKMKIDFPDTMVDSEGNTTYTDNTLVVIQGPSTNYQANLALRNGYIAYGGTQNDNACVTEEKFKDNVWYTFREYIDCANKKMKLYFSDETGHEYEGQWVQMAYGLTLSDVCCISLTRQLQGGMTTYVDYARMWDNALLPSVTSTYSDGLELNGAVGVPQSFSASLGFKNEITQEEMEQIKIGGGAEAVKELSADGKTVTLSLSKLSYRTVYTIDIPSVGLNAAKAVSFATTNPPWYLFGAEFDGYDDASKWGSFTDGCGYRDENDSNHTSWGELQNDGTLKVNNMNTGYGWWGIYYGEGSNALNIPSNKENIYLETRFNVTEDYGTMELMRFYGNRTSDAKNQNFFVLKTENGALTGVDVSGNSVSYALNANAWYTLRVKLNYAQGKAYYTIKDDSGVQQAFVSEFINRSLGYSDISYFTVLSNYPTVGVKYIDYVRLWDGDLLPPVTAVYGDNNAMLNGAVISGTELEARLTFAQTVPAGEIGNITINNGAAIQEATVGSDGTTVTLKITGLSGRNNYTIDIPALGDNAQNQISFSTADEPYYLFRAEFDGKDDTTSWGKTSNGFAYFSDSDIVGMVKNNQLVYNVMNTSYQNLAFQFADTENDRTINLEGKENIILEQSFKVSNSDGSLFYDKLLQIFDGLATPGTARNADVSIRVYTKTDSNTGEATNEIYYGGAQGDQYSLGIPLLNDVTYTLKLHMNYVTRMYSFEIADEYGNVTKSNTVAFTDQGASVSRTIGRINTMYTGSSYKHTYYQNYIRLIDDDLIPGAEVTYGEYNEKLDGAGSVKNGETVTVSFPNAITEADISAVKLDGKPVEGVLSSDRKVITAVLDGIGTRTFHTLTIDAIGINKAIECNFRSADEAKYMYRAEFDGYDDDTVWYLRNGDYNESATNSFAADGMYTTSFNNNLQENRYRAFTTVFKPTAENQTYTGYTPRASQALDCTGKENVTIETRIKVGEGKLDDQFMCLGNNIAMLRTGANRELRYDGDAGKGVGEPFMVNDAEFVIEPDVWYSITMRFDFVAQKYSVSVDDGRGNIANSGTLNFIYSHKKYEICDFRFSRMLDAGYAPMSIDYFRIIDEDYGKVNVTYGNGVKLNGSALVGINDAYTFTTANIPGSLSGITLIDEKGGNVSITASADGNTVTVTPAELTYNTKYTLTIPNTVIGSESNQTVVFTTIWNNASEFVYPEGYSADDALNVVFFGGSITNQEGWRKYTTDWIVEKFPNANCYNASIGGTGAEYGWTRLKRDVISKNPDLVFVEYAVNDSTNTETATYMESIVRNLNALKKPPVIIFVYTTVLDFNTNTYAISEQERVAKAYSIPSISIHDYMQSLYNTDSTFAADWDAKKYLPDSTHPTISGEYNGSKLYGDYVTSLMSSDSSKYFVKPLANSAVTQVTDCKNYVYDYDVIDKTLSTVGEVYNYKFSGEELVIEYKKSGNGGKFRVAIDGRTVTDSVDTYVTSSLPNSKLVYSGLGTGEHEAVITVLDKNGSSSGNDVALYCMFTAAASEPDAIFSIPTFDKTAVTEGVTVNVTFGYITPNAKPVVLIAAVYDAYGRLTGITKAETTTEATDTEKQMSLTVTPKKGDAKIRAFVWNSFSEMRALSDANELQ